MADSTVSFDIHTQNKATVAKLCAAQADFTEAGVRKALCKLILPEAKIHMPHPFGDLIGPDEFFETCFTPLFDAMPDLERRDWIIMGGRQSMAMIGLVAVVIMLERLWVHGLIFPLQAI